MLILPKTDKDSKLTEFKNGYKIIEDPINGNCFYKRRIGIDNSGN